MVTTSCSACGIVYGVPETWLSNRREDGTQFFCPNGHSQRYVETEAMKLKKQLAAKERELDFAKEESSRLFRQKENAVKEATRAKNKLRRFEARIAKGICPCCDRRFENLAQHMAEVHPDFVSDNPTIARGLGLLPARGGSTVRD